MVVLVVLVVRPWLPSTRRAPGTLGSTSKESETGSEGVVEGVVASGS